jgi:hypothetical protein
MIEETVEKLATKSLYHSHGSSIDADEAAALHLCVTKLPPDDALWQRIWLLRTMYQFDCGLYGYAKLFEAASISTVVSIGKRVS